MEGYAGDWPPGSHPHPLQLQRQEYLARHGVPHRPSSATEAQFVASYPPSSYYTFAGPNSAAVGSFAGVPHAAPGSVPSPYAHAGYPAGGSYYYGSSSAGWDPHPQYFAPVNSAQASMYGAMDTSARYSRSNAKPSNPITPSNENTEAINPDTAASFIGMEKTTPSTHCEVCKIKCNTMKGFQAHKVGKKHMKLQNRQEAISTKPANPVTPANENTEAFNADIAASFVGMEKTAPSTYCEVCNFECNTMNCLRTHKLGKKHKKKLQKLQEAIPPKPATTVTPANKNAEATNANIAANFYVMEKTMPSPRCEVCKIEIKGDNERGLQDHFLGIRHKKNLLRLQEATIAEIAANFVDIGMAKMTTLTFCEVCNFDGRDVKGLQDHMLGKEHKKNLKKLQGITKAEIAARFVGMAKTTTSTFCEVCKIEIEGHNVEGRQDHILGMMHKENLQKLQEAVYDEIMANLVGMVNIRPPEMRPPTRCEVCNKDLKSEERLQRHMLGRRHKKQQRRADQAAANANAAANFAVTTEERKSTCCEVCKIDCNTVEGLENYILGEKHLEKLQKLQEAITVKPEIPDTPADENPEDTNAADITAGMARTIASGLCKMWRAECKTLEVPQSQSFGEECNKNPLGLQNATKPAVLGNEDQDATSANIPVDFDSRMMTPVHHEACDMAEVAQSHKLGEEREKDLKMIEESGKKRPAEASEELEAKKKRLVDVGGQRANFLS